MCCKQLAGGIALAWPDAEIAAMGKAGAGKVLRKTDSGEESAGLSQALVYGYIDEVIRPDDTRDRIMEILQSTGR